MYRAPRAFAAVLAGFGLTACQLTPPSIQGTVEPEPQVAAPPAAVIVEQQTPIVVTPAPQVNTVTVIEREDSRGLIELSEFIAQPKLQRARLLSLRNDYKVNKSPTNALRLGAALSVVGTTDKPLSEAIRLLQQVPAGHEEFALATLMLDQAQKRISIVNTKPVVAAPKVVPKVVPKAVRIAADQNISPVSAGIKNKAAVFLPNRSAIGSNMVV